MGESRSGARPESTIEAGSFSGKRVCFTGRLFSMTREEASGHVHEAGGEAVSGVSARTDYLVVGLSGSPLDEEGLPTRKLQKALEIQRGGGTIRVLGESEFLLGVGLEETEEQVRRLYTTSQLGRLLDLSPRVIRTWVRAGLIRPRKTVHRLDYFDFGQVARAKSFSEHLRRGVPVARLRRSLEQLTRWWRPEADSLAQLAVLEREGELLVRLDDGALADASGQLQLEFEAPGTAGADALPAPSPSTAAPISEAEDGAAAEAWFERGAEFEDQGQLVEAAYCYQRSLLASGPRAETSFNLGNVFYALGRREEAAQRYLQAVEADPCYVEAWNNLGNVQSELGEDDLALGSYGRALRLAPEYADAHYNLAETLFALERPVEARPHYEAYLRHDPLSPWAHDVRDRLTQI